MKLSLPQFLAFTFMVGWIGVEVVGGTHQEKLCWASALTFIIAYLNNVHGLGWKYLLKVVSKDGKV